MTIDERLDRLAERHEALTQSVEMILLAQQKSEERLDRIEVMQEKNQVMQEKNEILLAHMLESMDSLARIVQVHPQRISNLEGGRS